MFWVKKNREIEIVADFVLFVLNLAIVSFCNQWFSWKLTKVQRYFNNLLLKISLYESIFRWNDIDKLILMLKILEKFFYLSEINF